MTAIATHALTKVFGATPAVDGIDLAVPEGSVFGFLGPNGAGKTTTIRMLLGLVRPTSGTIEVLGKPMPENSLAILPSVGSLVEGPAFYPFVSATRNLRRFDQAESGEPATRSSRIQAALERAGLADVGAKHYRVFSLGMKQRLALAAVFLRPRSLVILDEPSNGLDPQGTREVRHLVRSMARDGTTVFVSSHLLAEIEQTCTHVAVLDHGRIVAQDSLDVLRSHSTPTLTMAVTDLEAATRRLSELPGVTTISSTADKLTVTLDGVTPEACNQAVVLAGIGVKELQLHTPSLEDVFVSVTGGDPHVR